VTPLFGKHHEPDGRPTRGEIILFACAVVVGLVAWYVAHLSDPLK